MNHKDTVILICSYSGSKRIPQKIFKEINGKSVLRHIEDRIEKSGIDVCWLLPESEKYETRYLNICNDFYDVVSGLESPLHRMAHYLEYYDRYKYVIRITHDDILIDTKTMIDLLERVKKGRYDYGITPTILEGAGVEVIKAKNIIAAAKNHSGFVEHVSYLVKGKKQLIMKPRSSIERDYRLTLDYPKDLIVLQCVLKEVGNNASVDEICKYLDENYITKYNELPNISFYTCVYNGEKFIEETIKSVIGQMSSYDEYIIVDDCSTDKSLEIILNTINDFNANVTILKNDTNIGLASSSNIAIDNAKGTYVMRVDADDTLNGHACLWFVLEDADFDIAYFRYAEINKDNKITGKILKNKDHHAGCALMKRRFINELRFKDGLRHWDSLELYKRAKKYGTILNSDFYIWNYRRHKDSMSNNNLKKRRRIKRAI